MHCTYHCGTLNVLRVRGDEAGLLLLVGRHVYWKCDSELEVLLVFLEVEKSIMLA